MTDNIRLRAARGSGNTATSPSKMHSLQPLTKWEAMQDIDPLTAFNDCPDKVLGAAHIPEEDRLPDHPDLGRRLFKKKKKNNTRGFLLFIDSMLNEF